MAGGCGILGGGLTGDLLVYNLRGDGDNIPAGGLNLANKAVDLLVRFSADCCKVAVVFLTDSVVF